MDFMDAESEVATLSLKLFAVIELANLFTLNDILSQVSSSNPGRPYFSWFSRNSDRPSQAYLAGYHHTSDCIGHQINIIYFSHRL